MGPCLFPEVYQGCFQDCNTRVLPNNRTSLVATNSPSACVEYCRSRSQQFAGLQNGKDCACGNHAPRDSLRLEDSVCQVTVCTGDVNQWCGAPWKNAVYTTGIPYPESYQSEKVGCEDMDWKETEKNSNNNCHNLSFVKERMKKKFVKNKNGNSFKNWNDIISV